MLIGRKMGSCLRPAGILRYPAAKLTNSRITFLDLFDPFLLMVIGMIALMYFLTIRPQQKRARQHRELVADLQVGNEVLCAGGLAGTLERVEDGFVMVRTGETLLWVQRHAVTVVLPDGSLP